MDTPLAGGSYKLICFTHCGAHMWSAGGLVRAFSGIDDLDHSWSHSPQLWELTLKDVFKKKKKKKAQGGPGLWFWASDSLSWISDSSLIKWEDGDRWVHGSLLHPGPAWLLHHSCERGGGRSPTACELTAHHHYLAWGLKIFLCLKIQKKKTAKSKWVNI